MFDPTDKGPVLEIAWVSCQIRKIAHERGMPGMFSPPATAKETAVWRSRHTSRHAHHARAVMHVGVANPRWRGKRSWHFGRMVDIRRSYDESLPVRLGKCEPNWSGYHYDHDAETVSPLLTLCKGNLPVTGGFSPKRNNNAELRYFLCL